MNASCNLEVHFHEEKQASVILRSSGGEDEKYTEVLLFCCFALRQLVNLGEHAIARALAEGLARVDDHLREVAGHDSPDGPRLLRYPGYAAGKRFLATLVCAGDDLQFQMNAKGFGWFANGVGYYAPSSVLVLLRYLSASRIGDDRYLSWLGAAAAECARQWQAGAVSIANQTHVAARVTADRRPPTLTAENAARESGQKLMADLMEAFIQDRPSSLKFDALDQATRFVFHQIARAQAEPLRAACRAAASLGEAELLREVGKAVFDGYFVGRWIAGTDNTPVKISRDPEEAQRKGKLMLQYVETGRATELLHGGNEGVFWFLDNWAKHCSGEGIYASMPDRKMATALLLRTMVHGLCLAVAEQKAGGPMQQPTTPQSSHA